MSRFVAVVGWGRSGQGAAGVLLARDWRMRVFDVRGGQSLLFDDVAGVDAHADDDSEALARAIVEVNFDFVVVSLNVPVHHPAFSACRVAGIEVWGEVELVWRLQEESPYAGCPRPVVTGTNGKTTTVGMLSEILRCVGVRAEEVGSIGTPITWVIDSDAEVLAVELSSFQLHTVYTVSLLASIYLNVDADHLGWHGNAEAYAADKVRVYENTIRVCVYPASDRRVEQIVENADVVEGVCVAGLTLGLPSVSQSGIVEGLLVDRAFVEDRAHRVVALAYISDLAGVYDPHPSVAVVSDVLAATTLAHACGVEPGVAEAGLRAFRPAGHRRAIIAHTMDLIWVNDSKAMNAHAARIPLAGLSPCSAIRIVGGDAKGQDFAELIRQVELTLCDAVVIGEDRAPLVEVLQAGAPDVPRVEVDGHEDWMLSVANEAVALFMPGDTVVLAPACASWDQFDNYGQRGDAFTDAMSRLVAQWGSAGGDE